MPEDVHLVLGVVGDAGRAHVIAMVDIGIHCDLHGALVIVIVTGRCRWFTRGGLHTPPLVLGAVDGDPGRGERVVRGDDGCSGSGSVCAVGSLLQ